MVLSSSTSILDRSSSGAIEQVVDMLPMSKYARTRTIMVINHAISSVFLTIAKIVIFQDCLTWLLLRLYSVQFVYTSTLRAFIISLVPIFPLWLSSILATVQMFYEGRYISAVVLTVIYLLLINYGALVLRKDIPGHNVVVLP